MQISNGVLTLELSSRGGELRSIRTTGDAEWLWQGDPAFWGGRSPLLFPVVGKSPADTVTVAGRAYPMASHGVARVSDFTLEASGPDHARFALDANEQTRLSYPFDFRLAVSYRLDSSTIRIDVEASNRGENAMPMQFGFHPGFNWPLPGSEGRPHVVQLGNAGEPALHRLDANKLLLRPAHPSPFTVGRLVPDRRQYEDDAMIFPAGAGDAMSFYAEGGGRIDMRTRNLPSFALWQKPGAPFLCLEPWHGTAPYIDQGDALEARNGVLMVLPGSSASFGMDLTITPSM